MNGFERYTSILKGLPVDYLPRIPILMQFAAEYIGSDYAAFASDHRVLVRANQRCAVDFGIDQLSCGSGPCREAGSPYMVNAGCEIPSGTPVENLRAMCESVPKPKRTS